MKIDATQQKELLQASETIRSFIEHLEVKKGCISCYNWSGGAEGGCLIAEGKTPPQDVIQNGCEAWVIFDEIPF